MENVNFQDHVVDLDARELEFLNDQNFVPAGVHNFKHELLLPLCRYISGHLNAGTQIIVELEYFIEPTLSETSGNSVETGTSDSESLSFGQFYWPCRVLSLKGYYVLLEPQSYTEDSEPIWGHLLSEQIFPARYSGEKRIQPRKPNSCCIGPGTIKSFVESCYFGVPSTFPSGLHNIVKKEFRRSKINRLVLNPRQVMRFKKGIQVEVEVRVPEYHSASVASSRTWHAHRFAHDNHWPSTFPSHCLVSDYHVGGVTNIVGTRVEVTYRVLDGNNKINKTVWCDKDSDTVQPCGWSDTVGHSIFCKATYAPSELDTAGSKYENFDYGNIRIGQQLEVIYPRDRSRLHVATVTKLLKFGYIMVRAEVESGQAPAKICVHLSSPEIFPFGFAGRNKIERVKPAEAQPNKKQRRKWSEIERKKCPLVPESLLQKLQERPRNHCFAVDMKLEASDWYNKDQNLICPATVIRVVSDGNYQLLKIRYDGYGKGYEQWLAPSSCEIYPVGYSKLVRCPLQPPGPMRVTVKHPLGHDNEEDSPQVDQGLSQTRCSPDYSSLDLSPISSPSPTQSTTEWPRLDGKTIASPSHQAGVDCRDIMESVTADRALNPFEWTCNDLKQFLQLNNYWGSSLLRDTLPDSVDGKTLTSCTEIDVRKMVEHYEDARSRSSCLKSLVNLINYLRVLHWGCQM